MNDRQTNSLKMILLVLSGLKNTDRTSGITGLPARLTLLGAQAEEINALGVVQTQPVTGSTESRDAALENMKERALEIATAVALYATDAKLPDLLQNVQVSASDFDHARVVHRPWLATRIADAADDVLPHLAPTVTADMIEGLRTAIKQVREALNEPRRAIVTKTQATRRLVEAFQEADDNLAQIDRLLYPLRKSDPEFYADYKAIRKIVERAKSGGASDGASPTDAEAKSTASAPEATAVKASEQRAA